MKLNSCATLILAIVLVLSVDIASADSGWVNNQGCYCGTYASEPVSYISKGSGTTAERNASRDQMIYWNEYSTIYTPSVGTGTGAPANGLNEVNTFISSTDAVSIYNYTMDPNLYGVAIIQPSANFGIFNECKDFTATNCADFTETDVLINASFSSGWTTDPNDYSSALVQTTALHEIGHTWGAHHVFTLPAFGDSYSTMNYINDDSGQFVTRMDANTIRTAYSGTVQSVTDVGIFPFIFGNSTYGETYASVSPTTAGAGDNITVSNYLIQNIGNNTANSTVVSFYLSTDTTIDASDILIGTADFGNLAIDTESDENATLTIPAGTAEGNYYIGAVVTVGGSADDVTINNSFIIGRPTRTVVTVGSGGGSGCIVQDGGFEDGTPNPSWTEASTAYGSPLCDATCGLGGGSGAYTGDWWAWFGGVNGAAETGSVEQSVTIPSGSGTIGFYLEIPATGTNGYLRLLIDGNNLFEVTQADAASYGTYAPVSIDISAYADGGSHTVRFESVTNSGTGALNFFVDDVCLSITAGPGPDPDPDPDPDDDGDGGGGGGSGCFIKIITR